MPAVPSWVGDGADSRQSGQTRGARVSGIEARRGMSVVYRNVSRDDPGESVIPIATPGQRAPVRPERRGAGDRDRPRGLSRIVIEQLG